MTMIMARPQLSSPVARKIERIAAERAVQRREAALAAIRQQIEDDKRELRRSKWRAHPKRRARAMEAKWEKYAHRSVYPIPKSVEIIEEEVRASGLTLKQITSERKTLDLTRARVKIMWRLFSETKLSLPMIGARLNRHHSVVLRSIEWYMDRNKLAWPEHRQRRPEHRRPR